MPQQNVNITHFPRHPEAYQKVVSDLDSLGWSVHGWARAHRFPASSVYTTFGRWVGRTDRQPHGGKAVDIMQALQRTFAQKLTPQQLSATN